MKTGIVMEIRQSKAIIMGQGGEFFSVTAHSSWRVGDTVPIEKKSYSRKTFLAIAASFLLILLTGLYSGNLYFTEVSFLSMDINPSIEIGINRFNRVISVNARNEEGMAILDMIHLKNLKYEEAINLLLKNEMINSYISANAFVYFTLQSEDKEQERIMLNQVETYKKSILSHHANAQVEYYTVESNLIEEAHSHGMTAGKYKLLLELQEIESGIDIDDYSHHGIGEIMETIKEKCGQNQGGCGDSNINSEYNNQGHHH